MKNIIILSLMIITFFTTGCTTDTDDLQNRKKAENTEVTQEAENETETSETASERTVNGTLKNFTAYTLDGGEFKPEDFGDYSVTVINFWGTFCGPCISEMPDLAEFYNNLPDDVNFITYCTDAKVNGDSAQSIIDNAGLKAKVITKADGDFNGVLDQIIYIPTTIFVDKNGKIVGTEIIGRVENVKDEYVKHINEALSE